MREALKNAVHNAILLEYKLPHKVSGLDLDKSCLSSQNDICFSNPNPQEISKILSQVTASEIPPEVFDCFRVVGPKDKLILYSYISQMPWWTIDEIKRVSQYLAQSGAHRLYWNGFQQIMDMILPIVREDKLKQKLEYNALSPNARKVSDYGVPFKLIDCYDSKTPYDKGQFDEYEQHIDQEISRLFT